MKRIAVNPVTRWIIWCLIVVGLLVAGNSLLQFLWYGFFTIQFGMAPLTWEAAISLEIALILVGGYFFLLKEGKSGR